jgi:hypothetical protein
LLLGLLGLLKDFHRQSGVLWKSNHNHHAPLSFGSTGRCSNGRIDPGETGLDCGGVCRGFSQLCPVRVHCLVNGDCQSELCDTAKRICMQPAVAAVETCSDYYVNQDETDVDCGGTCAKSPTTQFCALGRRCKVAGDCESRYCTSVQSQSQSNEMRCVLPPTLAPTPAPTLSCEETILAAEPCLEDRPGRRKDCYWCYTTHSVTNEVTNRACISPPDLSRYEDYDGGPSGARYTCTTAAPVFGAGSAPTPVATAPAAPVAPTPVQPTTAPTMFPTQAPTTRPKECADYAANEQECISTVL